MRKWLVGAALVAAVQFNAVGPLWAQPASSEAWTRMSQIQCMLEYFFMEAGFYPTSLEELEQLMNSKAPRNATLLKVPKDPQTNQSFAYSLDKTGRKYKLSTPDSAKYAEGTPSLTNLDWGFLADLAELRRFEQVVRHTSNMIKGVATQVEMYAKDHNNNFPETMDDLVPKYIGRFPTDPVTGKNLIYKKVDKGYVVACPNPDKYGFKVFQYTSSAGMQVQGIKPAPKEGDPSLQGLPKLRFETPDKPVGEPTSTPKSSDPPK